MSNPWGKEALHPVHCSSPGPSSSSAAPRLGSKSEICHQFRSALEVVGARGAYGTGLVSVPSAPLSHGCPCVDQEVRWPCGVIPWSSQSHNGPCPCCGVPEGKVGLYLCADLTLLLQDVRKVVYKHVIFTAALYCYKQDSFMM